MILEFSERSCRVPPDFNEREALRYIAGLAAGVLSRPTEIHSELIVSGESNAPPVVGNQRS